MPVPFFRTMRSLQADTGRRKNIVMLLCVFLLLAGWGGWFFFSSMTLYQNSSAARLEVEGATYPVQATVGGRVIGVKLDLGRRVEAGDTLVQLDASVETGKLQEERSQLEALQPQLLALRNELTAEIRAQGDGRGSSSAGLEEARSRRDQAESAAALAAEQAKRYGTLHTENQISELEYLRAVAEAKQTRSLADAEGKAVAKLEHERGVSDQDREGRIERIKRDLARIEGEVNTGTAAVARLQQEIGKRTIRAAGGGRIGEAANIRVGAIIEEGERLASVVPAGELRIIADYSPSTSFGQLRAGQSARLRLDGFPWTEYGSVPATVEQVADEVRDGNVRVVLAVPRNVSFPVPLQHGMSGSVEIEVNHLSPALLLLRTIGRGLSPVSRAGRSLAPEEKQ